VLMADSEQKLYARWQPGTVKKRVSPHSYVVAMEDGSEKQLYVNKLRPFKPRISAIGVTFDDQATATLVLAFLEGGMLVARAQGGTVQFHRVIDQLIQLVKG